MVITIKTRAKIPIIPVLEARSMKSTYCGNSAWRSFIFNPRTNFIAFAAAYPQYDKKTGG